MEVVVTGATRFIGAMLVNDLRLVAPQPIAAIGAKARGATCQVDNSLVAMASWVSCSADVRPKHKDPPAEAINVRSPAGSAAEGCTSGRESRRNLPVRTGRVFGTSRSPMPPAHTPPTVVPALIHAEIDGAPLPGSGHRAPSRNLVPAISLVRVKLDAVLRAASGLGTLNGAVGANVCAFGVITEFESTMGDSSELEHRPTRVGDKDRSPADSSVTVVPLSDEQPCSLRLAIEAESQNRLSRRPHAA